MKFLRKAAIWLAALALFGGGYWFVVKKRDAHQREAAAQATPVLPPAFTVSKVVSAEFVETATVSGSLIAREEISWRRRSMAIACSNSSPMKAAG